MENATGYSLFFIDENHSGEVVGGAGYDLNNTATSILLQTTLILPHMKLLS